MKPFNGKAIYNPSGKAGEYSYWACNFYTGCSNNCDYCYCKRGVLSSTWSDKPKLKKCFKDEEHALAVFERELLANIDGLRRYGLFFTFTSDPMIEGTYRLTYKACDIALEHGIPVKILTKSTYGLCKLNWDCNNKHLVAFGFTLTGCDDKEPGASTNSERIDAMRKLHEAGFKTWASIEPIIDFERSYEMIAATAGFCDLYKIGLLSGTKPPILAVQAFLQRAINTIEYAGSKVYLKDSITKMTAPAECFAVVDRDYNIFTNK